MMIGCFLQTRESPKSPLERRATFSPLQIDRVCPIINHSHTSTTFEVSEWERAMTMTDRHSGFRRSGFRRSGLDIGGLDVWG